jgi:hypothetical protein
VALVGVLTVNLVLVAITLAGFFLADANGDWTLSYRIAADRVFSGGLYDWTASPYGVHYVFRYSPVAALIFAAIAWIGPVGWSLLHFAPLVALPRRLALLTLVSWPFWSDVYLGNVTVFVFVAAASALAGSTLGALAYLALCLLVPRPFMVPIALLLIWKRPRLRLPFASMFVIHGLLVALTGWGPAWLASLLRGGDDLTGHANLGPSALIGPLWIPIGLVLAGILLWRGRLGLASIAASPYWLPPYLLMVLLDLRGRSAKAH